MAHALHPGGTDGDFAGAACAQPVPAPAQQPQPEIARRLFTAYLHAGAHNARLLHEYHTVAAALADAGLEAIPLKGIHLATLVYPDPALRPMGDIDLLVRSTQVDTIGSLLLRLGYERFSPSRYDDPHAHHETYHATGRAPVELHWHLGQHGDQRTRPVDMEGLWARAVAAKIDGLPTRVLAPIDAFLYNCLHIYSHGFRVGLRRILDLREITRTATDALMAETLWTRAAAWRLTHPVAVLCEVLRLWLHVEFTLPIPRDAAFLAAVRMTQADLITIEDLSVDHVARLFGTQHWKAKAAAAFHQLFPPRSIMAARYGPVAQTPGLYGLYAWRVVQALWKYSPISPARRTIRQRARFLTWVDAE